MSLLHRLAGVAKPVSDGQSFDLEAVVDRLVRLAVRGLALSYDARGRSFPRTVRGRFGDRPPMWQGMGVRDGAAAALGLSQLPATARREVLAGQDLTELLRGVLGLSLAGRDPGAIALALWAAAELPPAATAELCEEDRVGRALDRLLANVRSEAPVKTVDHAWTLTALLAAAGTTAMRLCAREEDQLEEAAARAAERLLAAQSRAGIFPRSLPRGRFGEFRGQVGGFADQMFAVQALTRYACATGEQWALSSAQRCAAAVTGRQGGRGQWWAWYDWRSADVVERYPLRTVNQHAIAPLALHELREAGGGDHEDLIARGLAWLVARPETRAELLADEHGIIWRQVWPRGSRTRALGLGGIFQAGAVVRTCQPQDLGWLLYTWQRRRPTVEQEAGKASPTVIELPHQHGEAGRSAEESSGSFA